MKSRLKSGLLGAAVVVCVAALVCLDLVGAGRNQTSVGGIPWGAMGSGVLPDGSSVVSIASSESDGLANPAPKNATLTTGQVDAIVKLAIHRDTSQRNLAATISPGDWVAIKVNIVTAPIVVNGVGQTAYYFGGKPHFGQATDLRAVRAVLDYLVNEERDASRITIVEGGAEWAKTGMPGTDPRQTEDGWTVHWPAFDGLSYTDIVNQFNGTNGITVDIVDLNYDEWVSMPNGDPLPVPPGPNAAGPTWYQRASGYYVSKTLLGVDKLVNVAAMKTHDIPGITLLHKQYVGTYMQRAYGSTDNGKGGLHQYGGDKVPNGFVDMFSYRPTSYGIIECFEGTEGNGPQWGDDVQWNIAIASGDPVAADAVGATIAGFNPDDLGFLHMSAAKGFGTLDLGKVTVVGDPVDTVTRPFKKSGGYGGKIANLYGRGNRTWLVNGPYPGTIDTDAIPGAATLVPVEGEVTGEKAWKKVEGEERLVDFGQYAAANSITYAFTTIQSETEQTGMLFAGAVATDDGVQIWLNGVEITKLAKFSSKGLSKITDGVKVPVTLLEGVNTLMAKVSNKYSNAGIALIAGDPDADTLPGVRYSVTLPPEVTNVAEEPAAASPVATPDGFRFLKSFPNPFNAQVNITFELPKASDVRLSIHSLSGATVRELVSGTVPAGTHTFRWDGRDRTGRDLATGTYFARLQSAEGEVAATRLLMLK